MSGEIWYNRNDERVVVCLFLQRLGSREGMAYRIEFAKSVRHHLGGLSAGERQHVLDAIEKQLVHEPLVETRNRKPLRPNPVAPWELRVGNLRVFYEVTADQQDVVHILAVGRKERDRLFIAGRAVKL